MSVQGIGYMLYSLVIILCGAGMLPTSLPVGVLGVLVGGLWFAGLVISKAWRPAADASNDGVPRLSVSGVIYLGICSSFLFWVAANTILHAIPPLIAGALLVICVLGLVGGLRIRIWRPRP